MRRKMRNAKWGMRNAFTRPRRALGRNASQFRIPPFAFQIAPRPRGAFTLFEVILSLMILALLTGAVYSITSAAAETSRATMEEQVAVRRMEAFLKVTRDAFLNLPREGKVHLQFSKSPAGAPIPEIVFEESTGLFGIPSLGGGSLVLAARPRADGSRTMSLLRVPRDVQGIDLENLKAGDSWIPLLPRVEVVKWSFFANGEWKDEWPPENGRPLSARLQMDYLDMAGSKIDSQFWIPPVSAAAPAQQPAPTPKPTPGP